MVRTYQNGNKWIYEYDGEIIAVEYSRQMAVACGEARVKVLQANTAYTGLAGTQATDGDGSKPASQ